MLTSKAEFEVTPSSRSKILVAGSRSSNEGFDDACTSLGRTLADDFDLIVGSVVESTADYHITVGALQSKAGKVEIMWSTTDRHSNARNSDPEEVFHSAIAEGRVHLSVESLTWSEVHEAQVRQADAVLIVGGSSGTAEIANLARRYGKPLVALGWFGGTGLDEFERAFQEYRDILERDVEAIRGLQNDSNELTCKLLKRMIADRKDQPEQSLQDEEDKPKHMRGLFAFHDDEPAETDALRRREFSRILAKRMRQMQSHGNGRFGQPLLVQLDGPWGAGKSTILRFLRDELDKDPSEISEVDYSGKRPDTSWMTVEINAWENREAEPWWTIIDAVHREATGFVKQKNWFAAARLWCRIKIWRVASRWAGPVICTCLALLLIWIITLNSSLTPELLTIVSGVAALLGTVFVMGYAIFKSLFSSWDSLASRISSHSGQSLINVTEHFCWLVSRVDSPVLVMIDDLDRCDQEQVVAFLEVVQNVFRERGTVFVVAADQRWIQTAFEARYSTFSRDVVNPGRSLGASFLDKLFQLTVPVPPMRAEDRDRYWRSLARGKGANSASDGPFSEREFSKDFVRGATQEELTNLREEERSESTPNPELRFEIAQRRADPDFEEQVEAFLGPFAPLLESNPRAMKRLVNYYGVTQQVMDVFGGTEDPPSDDEVALWCILRLRWPRIADYLARNPDDLGQYGSEELSSRMGVSAKLLECGGSVDQVIRGHGVSGNLTSSTIRALAGLRSA